MEKKRFAIKTPTGVEFLKQKDIIYCSAHGRYSQIHTLDGQRFFISKLLSELELCLDSGHFFRTHRSYIVNLDHVVKYDNNGRRPITLVNEKKIELSRRRRSLFIQRLNQKTIRI